MHRFDCPWCGGDIEVRPQDVNCSIFRHAVLKATGVQVDPHLGKEACERLVAERKVWGCCRPIKFDGKRVTKLDRYL